LTHPFNICVSWFCWIKNYLAVAPLVIMRSDKRNRSIDELQADLDLWIREYNEARPHQGPPQISERT
jgi:transposase InsO family protein